MDNGTKKWKFTIEYFSKHCPAEIKIVSAKVNKIMDGYGTFEFTATEARKSQVHRWANAQSWIKVVSVEEVKE